jgi:hypothetical protein
MSNRTFLIFMCAVLAVTSLFWGAGQAGAQYVPPPNLIPGVNWNIPNYANSPVLTKFKDTLPGLGAAGANNLSNYIPVATPMGTNTPAGVPRDGAYYEIAVVEYTQKLHSELGVTNPRG